MKAILYRDILNDGEAWDSASGSGWNIHVLSEDATQSSVRYIIEGFIKTNNEVQLIDYTVHMENTYTVNSMLNSVTLGLVESFYNEAGKKQSDVITTESSSSIDEDDEDEMIMKKVQKHRAPKILSSEAIRRLARLGGYDGESENTW